MIAPLREPETRDGAREAALREARRAAAAMLPAASQEADRAPPVPTWQAWLLVAWMIVSAAAFLAAMLRLM